MKIKEEIKPENFEVGVIIGRFQGTKLHKDQYHLFKSVLSKHKQVIILLGVPIIQNTKRNPLSFAVRKAMIQKKFPNVVILPIKDCRYNSDWSKNVDAMIAIPFGEKKTIIYGSRDSFIPSYEGKHSVLEIDAKGEHNASALRKEISKENRNSEDFRAGIIHSVFQQRAVLYSTVDVTAYNDKGEILMAKKPNQALWRFVGGFVDLTDNSTEEAALREFREETGGNCEIGNLQYITSRKVEDWRYAAEESGIMTTLFLGKYKFGHASASDDIEIVQWIPIQKFSNYDGIRTLVMPEHREIMKTLVDKVYNLGLIPNIGKRLPERTDKVEYISE
jgi:bifunctional NMN adenylyltransferase/nudix hydrolase